MGADQQTTSALALHRKKKDIDWYTNKSRNRSSDPEARLAQQQFSPSRQSRLPLAVAAQQHISPSSALSSRRSRVPPRSPVAVVNLPPYRPHADAMWQAPAGRTQLHFFPAVPPLFTWSLSGKLWPAALLRIKLLNQGSYVGWTQLSAYQRNQWLQFHTPSYNIWFESDNWLNLCGRVHVYAAISALLPHLQMSDYIIIPTLSNDSL
jgi:hypothetical protein